MLELEKFHTENNTVVQQKYPEVFDPKWIVTESGWPYFHLSSLDGQPWKEMYKEAEALSDKFHVHRDTYGDGWKSLTLHGLDEDTQSLDTYGDRQDTLKQLDWTWVADKCPVTKKFLTDVWPAEFFNRVRFMLLEPGGYILPHQDRQDHEKRLSVCNISLNNPEGCNFALKDKGRVPFKDEGSAFLMDISNVHSVWNTSDKPRIHMIIHYELGRRVRDFFYVLRESYFINRG
ncbi:uncharacterized protein METZ01_LOCUS37760 [marine metagenome]|uniref:Aspartyl/asparaginy/proline hydroxylase domain-containing protein n=1 Tax=marine metagenome TaxID=408172 RepID=A0A381QZN0_9ZZZZ